MKLKKLFAITLAGCLAAQLFVGCGKQDPKPTEGAIEAPKTTEAQVAENPVSKDGLPIVAEPETLSVLTVTPYPEIMPEDVVIHQEIKAATNVNIDWTVISQAAWAEKKGLTLAKSELPDIMLGDNLFTDTDLLNMVDAGQVIALDELMKDYAPNFNTIMNNQPGLREAITANDGHIYGLPFYYGAEGAVSGVLHTGSVTYINKTWLDKLGMEIPTTTEELKVVLKAFKDKDPNGNGMADEIPLSTSVGQNLFDDWMGAFGLVPQANENNYKYISTKDGKVVFSAMEDEYKEGLKYFHDLWAEGLIDPEAFTQDDAMFNAKLKTETRTVGMFLAWRGTAWRLSDDDTEYVVLPPLSGPEGDSLYPEMYMGVKSRAGCVITTSCDNPELAMRWADYLVSPENGYQFWTKAKIGFHLEDGGERYNLINKIDVSDPEHQRQVMLGFTCVDHTVMNKKPINPDPLSVDVEKHAADEFYFGHYPTEHYPNTFLTLEEGKIIAQMAPQLKSYVDQMVAQWITSGGIDDDWDGYVNQLKKMGVEDYIGQFQAALDRYNSVK